MPDYIKINEYPIERFQFGDDDYYDVDYWDGTNYQTAKIKGSVIKQAILDSVVIENIYNSDGVLTSFRQIDGNGFAIQITQLESFTLMTNSPIGQTGFTLNHVTNNNRYFDIRDSVGNVSRFRINSNGQVEINQAYKLPLADGTIGQFLKTDGAGNLAWQTLSGFGDMLKSQYDPDNDGIVETARKIGVKFINKTGSILTKGTIVYLKSTSASTTYPEAEKANANSEATSSKTIGAVYEDVPIDGIGLIITHGEVDNLNTSAYTLGTKLWLSTTSGQVTNVPPTQPNHSVFIGTVTRSQNTNGRILYSIQNGFELDELHNVLITNPLNGQVLAFDTATNLWKNIAIPNPNNIYNSDGTLSSDRVLNGNFQSLTFDQIRGMVFNCVPAPIGYAGFVINVVPVGSLFVIKDLSANKKRLEVLSSGALRLMDSYNFPLVDGVNGQVLTTDGAGNLSFQPIPIPAVSWNPPNVQLFDGFGSGSLTTVVNSGAGYNRYFNGTGTAGRLNFNIHLKNNGVDYDGSAIKIRLHNQIFGANTGGSVSWTISYKFVTSNGTTNAETTATSVNTAIVVTGRTANFMYDDLLATITGTSGSDMLMLSITRNTGGGTNSDVIDAIGIELTK